MQNAEDEITNVGVKNFLKHYEEGGAPKTLPFKVGTNVNDIPQHVLQSHRPLHHSSICFETEVYLSTNKSGQVEVDLKKRRGVAPARIKIQYAPEEYSPEGVARHKQDLLDHHLTHTTNGD